MSAVAGIGKLIADVVKSADSIVRGLGDLGRLPSAIEQRIIEAHEQADAAEANHVERSALSPDDARRVIRQILGKKVAEGLTVAVKHDGHNIFIGILPPIESEKLEAIAERAIREAKQIKSVHGDTVETSDEMSEQDNSIAEGAGESAPVQAPDTIMIDGVEVESSDLERYLAPHPSRP